MKMCCLLLGVCAMTATAQTPATARVSIWAKSNGAPSCTATFDGERIVAINGSGVFAAQAMAISDRDAAEELAVLRLAADRSLAASKATAAPASKRLALRKLKDQWIALGYQWPPKKGELVGVVAAKLADVATLMDSGKTKEGVKLLANCTAALALYNYCGTELALTADVPED